MPEHICCRESADTSADDHDIMVCLHGRTAEKLSVTKRVADSKIFSFQGGGACGFDQEGRIDGAPSRDRSRDDYFDEIPATLIHRYSNRLGA